MLSEPTSKLSEQTTASSRSICLKAGLYIHLPWCERRCPYCDYTVAVQRKPHFEHYVEIICRQLEQARTCADFSTVYIGGGTPSMLPTEHVRVLGRAIADAAPDAIEFTVEFNPEHAERPLLDTWRAAGAGRVSLGSQSLQPETLKTLGRAHRGSDVFKFVDLARRAGFEHISADVIYGVPGAPPNESALDAATLASLDGIDHISAYELTWEPATVFEARRKRGKMRPPSHDSLADQAQAVDAALSSSGMTRYEVASWASSRDTRSKHNSAYWESTPYVGLGVGAHSFLPTAWLPIIWGHRGARATSAQAATTQNTTSHEAETMVRVVEERSLARLYNNSGRLNVELLSSRSRFDEICIVRLRTADGLNIRSLPTDFTDRPHALKRQMLEIFGRWSQRGFGELNGDLFCPSSRGMDYADSFALELMHAADSYESDEL